MKFHLSLTETDIRKIICDHIERNYGIPAEPSDLAFHGSSAWSLDFDYDSRQSGKLAKYTSEAPIQRSST
jgi:hypothetical protein